MEATEALAIVRRAVFAAALAELAVDGQPVLELLDVLAQAARIADDTLRRLGG